MEGPVHHNLIECKGGAQGSGRRDGGPCLGSASMATHVQVTLQIKRLPFSCHSFIHIRTRDVQ